MEEITVMENDLKKNENRFRDLWHNIKHSNIQIIGVPEEEKDKRAKEIFWDIIENSFLTWEWK